MRVHDGHTVICTTMTSEGNLNNRQRVVSRVS